MIREIRSMAAALAELFGTPQRVADEIRLLVSRSDLVELRAVYYPPNSERAQPTLILDTTVTGAERALLLLDAVAHAYLRHRSLGYYEYGVAGPLYDSPRERTETNLFVQAFQARSRVHAYSPNALLALRRNANHS